MANSKNLKPFDSNQNRDEAAKNGRKGGQKSGERRRERKKFKELLEIALQLPFDDTGKQNDFVITAALITKAINGDVKAYEVIRDTIGEKPKDVQEVSFTPVIIKDDI